MSGLFDIEGWFKKLLRSYTSVLPVSENRIGECKQCGECCKLPIPCMFLDDNNKCMIYEIRPLNCRVYPQSKASQEPILTCGYTFMEFDDKKTCYDPPKKRSK